MSGQTVRSWEVHETGRSGSRLVVTWDDETTSRTHYLTACTGERRDKVVDYLKDAVAAADAEDLREFATWSLLWSEANAAQGNRSRTGQEAIAARVGRGKGWAGGTDSAEHRQYGFAGIRAIPAELREALKAYVVRHAKGSQQLVHNNLIGNDRGPRVSTAVTSEQMQAGLLNEQQRVKGAAAKKQAKEAYLSGVHVQTEEEAALVAELAAHTELHTRGEAKSGAHPSNISTVGLMYEAAGVRSQVGLWHGDNPGPPSAAVMYGLQDGGWVPPFGVDPSGPPGSDFDPRPTRRGQAPLLRRSYKELRQRKWDVVRATNRGNEGHGVPTVSMADLDPELRTGIVHAPAAGEVPGQGFGKTVRSWGSSGNPTSLVGFNEYGWKSYYVQPGKGHSAAQEPRRKLEEGTGLLWDATMPHSSPGAMATEGDRITIYLGYQGRDAAETTGAPVLAFPPLRGKEGVDYHPVYDSSGRFALPEGSGNAHGKKRARE